MTTFLDTRKTISLLHNEIPNCPYLDTLSDTYDMYRRVSVSFLTMVTHYSYLEHLARPITTSQEFSEFLNNLQNSVSSKLLYLTSARNSVNPVHILEDRIKEHHLDIIPSVDIKCVLYRFKGTGFKIEEHIPKSNKYPICYVLTYDDKYYILYTPVMSFLDGYDSYTGERKHNIIPDSFIEYARGVIYYEKEECEPNSPKGKRKIKVSTPKFSKVMGISLFKNTSTESLDVLISERLTQNSSESRNSSATQHSYQNEHLHLVDRNQSRNLSHKPPEIIDSESLHYSSRCSIRSSGSSLHSESSISDPELESPCKMPKLSSSLPHGRLFQSLDSQCNYLKTLPEELEDNLDSEERMIQAPSPESSSTDWFYDNMFIVSASPNNRFYPRSSRYDQPDWRTVHTSRQPTRDNCTGCNIF